MTDKHLRCSFCGKSKESVKKFISGPNVYICNECISLCNEILAEEEPTPGDHGSEDLDRAIAEFQDYYAGALIDTLSVQVARRIMRQALTRAQ